MKHVLRMWKEKVETEIKTEMAKEVSFDTIECTDKLMGNWLLAEEFCEKFSKYEDDTVVAPCSCSKRLTNEELISWNDNMMNADGTKGPHWTIEQTNSVAGSFSICFTHITPEEWNVTMNMMYSDYYSVGKKFNLDMPTFCAELAKAFLFDNDGGLPYLKLSRYYNWIVKKATVY